MKGLMPDKNRLRRSKIGFVNSEWEWLQAKKTEILEIFNSPQFRARPYWHADQVASDFTKWVNGELRGDGLMFWRILSTELWLRKFVD
jgi:asparagine synthase (glutamine-hydrolysing)